jgi:hypothetical protein
VGIDTGWWPCVVALSKGLGSCLPGVTDEKRRTFSSLPLNQEKFEIYFISLSKIYRRTVKCGLVWDMEHGRVVREPATTATVMALAITATSI